MDQPNVLLICTDHWPGKMIGALGHPAVFTPTIDQMAALGIAFTNAYATTPTCIPARRELMTGTFSKTHGDRVFDGKTPMPQPTIAQVFRDAGYQAYGVGKLHVNPPRDRCCCSMIMSGCKCSMKMSVHERTDVDDERAVEDTGVERSDRGQGDGG